MEGSLSMILNIAIGAIFITEIPPCWTQVLVHYARFEKTNFLQVLVGRKKVARSTNVIESLWEKKVKKYPAHQIGGKKNS